MTTESWVSWDPQAFDKGLKIYDDENNGDGYEELVLADFGGDPMPALVTLFEYALEWKAYELSKATLAFVADGLTAVLVTLSRDNEAPKDLQLEVEDILQGKATAEGPEELAAAAAMVVGACQKA